MQTGKLDQKITLYSYAQTNDRGMLKDVYTKESIVWGHVISQRGTEAFEAARTNAKQTIRVLVRFRPDISTKWKFEWEGQEYNITALDSSQRRAGELWITGQVVGAL